MIIRNVEITHLIGVAAISDDLQQVLVTHEVKPAECRPLSLQEVTQCLLQVSQTRANALQRLLNILDVQDLNNLRRLARLRWKQN